MFLCRSNCDSSAANVLRKYYQKPYFLPDVSESSRTDWIFMGCPGYGAHLHVSFRMVLSLNFMMELRTCGFQNVITSVITDVTQILNYYLTNSHCLSFLRGHVLTEHKFKNEYFPVDF